MPDARTIDAVLSAAERAATAGDFSAAEPLLRRAIALQEAAPGPGLVNGLNNLGVVYERLERYGEAERAYRRAYEVARRVLPERHSFTETVEDNLRQFCSARGLAFPPSPIADEVNAGSEPRLTPADAAHLDAFHTEPGVRGGPVAAPAESPQPPARSPAAPEAPPAATVPPAPVTAPSSVPAVPTPAAPEPPLAVPEPSMAAPDVPPSRGVAASGGPNGMDAAGPHRRGWSLALAASGVTLVAAVYLLLSLDTPAGVGVNPPGATMAGAPASPAPAATDPSGVAPLLTPTPPVTERPESPATETATSGAGSAETAAAPAPAPPAVVTAPATAPGTGGAIRLLRAAVCDDFATQGAPDWRCRPVAAEATPRRLTFYTRVAADRTTTVEHVWYRDDALRQRVPLTIRANGAGFRTYSRHLTAPGAWRVELRSAANELLHEERFVIR